MTNHAPTTDGERLTLGPCTVTFERTLRIPDDGEWPLPPGFGGFPLRVQRDGDVLLPIRQHEAMWLRFEVREPVALQVWVGEVCALTGEGGSDELTQTPQNYLTLPDQPWLDGINAGDGFIRQFVAAPLGSGATVEGQITGTETTGGIQLRAVGLTDAALSDWLAEPHRFDPSFICGSAPGGMGLGAGGRMVQEIYADERPLSDYDPARSWSASVRLCSTDEWTQRTGEPAPPSPVDVGDYLDAGLPWFAYFDVDRDDLPASERLASVRPVGDFLDATSGGAV